MPINSSSSLQNLQQHKHNAHTHVYNFSSLRLRVQNLSNSLNYPPTIRILHKNTMISSVKHTPFSASTDFLPKKRFLTPTLKFSPLPIIQNSIFNNKFSSEKPLHISSTQNLTFSPKEQQKELKTQCNAYEADRSRPLDINIEVLDEQARFEAAQRLKIGIYFATWWALNVVFNIYNKKVLNAFPYPWLTSTLSLACGSLMMLVSWATRIAEAPKTDLEFWKSLFPVS